MKCPGSGNSRFKYSLPVVAALLLLAAYILWILLHTKDIAEQPPPITQSNNVKEIVAETQAPSEPPSTISRIPATTATDPTVPPEENDANWPELNPIVFPTVTAWPESSTSPLLDVDEDSDVAVNAEIAHFPESSPTELILAAADHQLTGTIEPVTSGWTEDAIKQDEKPTSASVPEKVETDPDDDDLFWLRRPKGRLVVDTTTTVIPPHKHHQRVYHVTGHHHHHQTATPIPPPTTTVAPGSIEPTTATLPSRPRSLDTEISDLIDELDIDNNRLVPSPVPAELPASDDNEIRPVVFEIDPEESWNPPVEHARSDLHQRNDGWLPNELPRSSGSDERQPSQRQDLGLKPPEPVWRREQPVPARAPEPVWRRRPPEGLERVTPPPPPPMPVGVQDDPAKVKPFQFGISATVTTTFRNKGKSQDNEIKPAFHASLNAPTERRRNRRNTPVIVTALMDIGRGEWVRFTRHFDIYLTWLLDLLQVENRVIIYCDESVVNFLVNRVEIDWDRLQVVVISLRDLPFYRYREEIQKIIDAEQENWQDKWDLRVRDHPEAKFAEYDILVNSKPYLLKNATQISRFATEFFVWVDAGYSHGSQDVIPRGLWDPQLTPGKITLIKLTGTLDKAHRYTLDLVYRKERSVISGGFLAGDVATIQRLYVFFYITFMGLLDNGKVDDDQTTLLMTIRDYSSTFNILTGGWFDAFKMFPSRSAVADNF